MPTHLAENFQRVQERLVSACHRVGRDPASIHLVWVSKTHPVPLIQEALKIGAKIFGESRVQEMEERFPLETKHSYELHFIGRIQSNKLKKIVHHCSCIHSLDSQECIERVNALASAQQKKIKGFIQINVSGENTKAGYTPEQLYLLLENLPPLSHLEIIGLMTIGHHSEDKNLIRQGFKTLRECLDGAKSRYIHNFPGLQYLSMGMSGDFEVALEEGSHYIRIGSDLFGSRA
jgi:PLP dependent protein